MLESKTYTLIEPIEFGSERIDTITFQPVRAKHLRNLKNKNDIDDTLTIASQISGLTSDQLDMMGAEDTMAVVRLVGSFLRPGQKTGENGTPQ